MTALGQARSRWGIAAVVVSDAGDDLAVLALETGCAECGSQRVVIYDLPIVRPPMCGDCGAVIHISAEAAP